MLCIYFSLDNAFSYFLVFTVLGPAVSFVQYCYNNKEGNGNMMYNQSCRTGEVHLDDELVSTDYLTSPRPTVETDTTDSPRSHASMCYVVRYITKQNLSSAISARSSNVSFGCDFQYRCAERGVGLHRNVSVGGHRGDLYCCERNNCNSVSVMPPLPPPQICYTNTHHWGQNVRIGPGTSAVCKDPDSWCIRSRLLDIARSSTVFYCDNQHLCQFYNMTAGSSSVVCRNVSTERGKEELCCCSGQTCFTPAHPRFEANAFDSFMSSEDGINRGLSSVTIGCIVAFTLLALVGVGVMVGLMYQRQNHPHTSSLTLTYSRIEEEDASDSIQML